MTPIRVAIYTRVSTDNQAEKEFNSCEAQEAKIRAFVSSQENMIVQDVYSDAGYSGATIERPALERLLQAIIAQCIDLVIVYKIDRLTRSPKDFYQLIELFEKHNVSFISITERFDTSTPSGRLLRNIMLTFAQFERELTSERTKDKMLERARKGLYGGGVCPFGYKRVEKKLVVEPDEAESVRQMFKTYIETASLFKTYAIIKKAGIRNRGGKIFSKSDLAYLLRRQVYIGKVVHQGNTYPAIHPAIISDNQFSQAQKIHGCKLVPKWHPAKSFLFPGLITCKECGSAMTPTYTNKLNEGKRKRYFYYRCTCTYKRDWTSCPIRQVNANRLDAHVVQSLDRVAHDAQYLEGLSFMLNKKQPGASMGFELSAKEPEIQPNDMQEVLKAVIEIANGRDGSNKAMAFKSWVKTILYSRDMVEIELFLKTALPRSWDAKTDDKPASAHPKMPRPIFGCAEEMAGIEDGTTLGKRKVRAKKMAAGLGFEPR